MIDASTPLIEQYEDFMRTGVAEDASLQGSARQHSLDAWNQIVDRSLIEWALHPERIEEDGLEAPTARSLDRAARIALNMRAKATPPPQRVAPDGDGGIVFEWMESEKHLTLACDRGGKLEIREFENGQLRHREQLGS
ncbi:MAG TPA: hypothetical protein VF669_11350 [Tepidisphaeraceae bacterium]